MSSLATGQTRDGPRVAVIGCGMFGAMIALRLAENGANVTVFERGEAPLLGASYNNQNRLHLGYHYPRDDETARQCVKGFQRFRDEFGPCIRQGFPNAYFIADKDSMTSAESYLAFCDRMALGYERIDLSTFRPRVRGVDLGVLTDEVVYDCGLLRASVRQRLSDSGVKLHFGVEVARVFREGAGYMLDAGGQVNGSFDAVVNSTYANINHLNSQLGYPVPEYQYEYTMVPILEWDQSPTAVTVMDGRFMTVLPFGKTGRFLLYHVSHTVVATEIGTELPAGWLDPQHAPAQQVDSEALFSRMVDACAQFVPALEHAKLAGFLKGPRVVLAHRNSTDARPSIVESHEPGYWSVFSGKIDHCMWVADEIAGDICSS